MGVKQYKKYWPDGGSWWNETHMNPNNRSDLERTVSKSKESFRNHVNQMINEVLILGLIWVVSFVFNLLKGKDLIYIGLVLLVSTLRHSYGLMVHMYNSFKAQDKLSTLPKEEPEPVLTLGMDTPSQKVGRLGSCDLTPTLTIYTVRISHFYGARCHFRYKKMAEAFMEHLDTLDDGTLFQLATNKKYAEEFQTNFISATNTANKRIDSDLPRDAEDPKIRLSEEDSRLRKDPKIRLSEEDSRLRKDLHQTDDDPHQKID